VRESLESDTGSFVMILLRHLCIANKSTWQWLARARNEWLILLESLSLTNNGANDYGELHIEIGGSVQGEEKVASKDKEHWSQGGNMGRFICSKSSACNRILKGEIRFKSL